MRASAGAQRWGAASVTLTTFELHCGGACASPSWGQAVMPWCFSFFFFVFLSLSFFLCPSFLAFFLHYPRRCVYSFFWSHFIFGNRACVSERLVDSASVFP